MDHSPFQINVKLQKDDVLTRTIRIRNKTSFTQNCNTYVKNTRKDGKDPPKNVLIFVSQHTVKA